MTLYVNYFHQLNKLFPFEISPARENRKDLWCMILFMIIYVHLIIINKVQNSATKLVFKAHKRDYVQSLLQALHWLLAQARIDYKLSTACHSFFSDSSPAYLCLSSHCVSSADTRIHHVRAKTFGQCCFSYCAPRQWKFVLSDNCHIQSPPPPPPPPPCLQNCV